MNVSQLIERLQDLDPNSEVLLAHQPSWPLQFTVAGVAASDDIAGESECDDHGHYSCDDCASQEPGVVYIVEGDHPDHPYAPRAAWEVAQ